MAIKRMKIRDKENLSESIKKSPPSAYGKSFLAYGAYFNGYSEYMVPKKNGKGYSVRRIYTGVYEVAEQLGDHWLLWRVMYLVALLAGGGLFIHATICAFDIGTGIGALIAQAVAAVAGWLIAWLMFALLEFILAGKKLTVSGFSRREKVCRRSKWAAWAMVAYIGVMLLVGLINHVALSALSAAVEAAVGAALIYGIGTVENRVEYKEIKSDDPIPVGAKKVDASASKRLADLDEYPTDEDE